jgi:hypothetical protein
MTTPTRATISGRAYLDLRRKARQDRRPVDELLQLYILECFLARLTVSRFADQFVLKGGLLLAAFGERHPTRDIDLQAQTFDNESAVILPALRRHRENLPHDPLVRRRMIPRLRHTQIPPDERIADRDLPRQQPVQHLRSQRILPPGNAKRQTTAHKLRHRLDSEPFQPPRQQ